MVVNIRIMQMLHSGLVTLVVFSTFVQLVWCNVDSAKNPESSSTSVPEVTNLITEEENRSFDETLATVSVGIRSFTVEVTTPFEKPSVQDVTKTPSNFNVLQVKSMNKTDKTFVTEDNNGTSNDPSHTAAIKGEGEFVKDTATIESTSSPSPSPNGYEDKSVINDVHVEKQLKNGLYRIKIAEIITDEFDNALGDDEFEASINRNKLYNNGKINIADLYPSQDEDFGPIIKESNERLLKDKHIFVQDDAVDDDGNLKGSSIIDIDSQSNLQSNGNTVNIPTTKIEIELIDEPSLSSDVIIHSKNDEPTDGTDKITDFTKQLLQENDKVVSTIERSFVNVNKGSDGGKVSASPVQPKPKPTVAYPVNTQIKSMEFIDRRVKKHDPTFKYKIPDENEPDHVDFANTKFNSNDDGNSAR